MISVWEQAMRDGLEEVTVAERRISVGRTRSMGLKMLAIPFGDAVVEGIEQNPEKPSTWGKQAKAGKRIMQFKSRNRFVGNVCEGKLTRYPSWKSLGLPD